LLCHPQSHLFPDDDHLPPGHGKTAPDQRRILALPPGTTEVDQGVPAQAPEIFEGHVHSPEFHHGRNPLPDLVDPAGVDLERGPEVAVHHPNPQDPIQGDHFAQGHGQVVEQEKTRVPGFAGRQDHVSAGEVGRLPGGEQGLSHAEGEASAVRFRFHEGPPGSLVTE
jgi:hypothetical protein